MSGILHFFKGIFGFENKSDSLIGLAQVRSGSTPSYSAVIKKQPKKELSMTDILKRSN
jgi:hypothetical protein